MRRTSQGWVLGVAGLTLALAGALTGCAASDGSPPTGATTSASSNTSTTVGATVSTGATTAPPTTAAAAIPPEATKHTEEGAKAFVKYFVDQMSTSAYEADSSAVARLSSSSCKGCTTLIAFADDLKAKGHHVDRRSVSLRGQIVMPNSTHDRYVIDALIEDHPSKVVDSRGNTVSEEAGERFTLRNTVAWARGAWLMDENLLVMN